MKGRRRKWGGGGGGMYTWVGKESSVPSHLLVTCSKGRSTEAYVETKERRKEGEGR